MKTRACERCQKPFTSKRPRRFCDRRCAAIVATAKRGTPAWSEDEKHFLETLAGNFPSNELVKRFQNKSKREGWPTRTDGAVKTEIKRLGLSLWCVWDNVNPSELARTLGVSRDRVELWCEKGLLPYRYVAGGKRAIELRGFTKFCRQHPGRLAGIDPERIEWLTRDSGVGEAIAKLPPPTLGYPQPVKRLDTGEEFPSVKAAARASCIHPSSLREAIARGGTSAGTKWQYVKQSA